jgi:hypothetical protein
MSRLLPSSLRRRRSRNDRWAVWDRRVALASEAALNPAILGGVPQSGNVHTRQAGGLMKAKHLLIGFIGLIVFFLIVSLVLVNSLNSA